MGTRLSPDVSVMLRPASSYPALASRTSPGGPWMLLRRPLFLSFVLGCTISLVTFPGLTLRLAGPSTVYWSFVPLVEILAFAVVSGSINLPFSRKVDLFFTGHLPWLLWLACLSCAFSFLSPGSAFAMSIVWLYGVAPVVMVWSLWIDFCFYRSVAGDSSGVALRRLLLQRLLSWGAIALIFFGSVTWQIPR